MDKDNFSIGKKKKSIEENIRDLEKELEIFSGGAPKLGTQTPEKRDEPEVKSHEEDIPAPPAEEEPEYKKTYKYQSYNQEKERVNIFKNNWFYICLFAIISIGLLFFKAPMFRYTTPFRRDHNLPQIDIGFKYYNNILGKNLKSETLVRMGNDIIVIPVPMDHWVNLKAEQKLILIQGYME